MPKLSDTQLIILSAACTREDRMVLPLPQSLKGGAAVKVIDALIAKGLVTEVEADRARGDMVWRDDGNGGRTTLVATAAAEAALEGRDASRATAAPAAAPRAGKANRRPAIDKATQARKTASTPAKVAPAPTQPKIRDGTKQAQLIAMLKRAKGASIEEIAETLGWQAHTVRGALAGALKKRLRLTIASEPHETRGRVYRIAG